MGEDDKTAEGATGTADKAEVKTEVKTDKPFAVFKTQGEFNAEMDRKTKNAVAQATQAMRDEIYSKLGILEPEELEVVAKKMESAKAAVSETDRIKNDLTRAQKLLAQREEQNKNLVGWKHSSLKKQALTQFSNKVADFELMSLMLEPKLVINDDDTVSGPNGKPLDDMIEDLLKQKPILKIPDFKAGAGTTPAGGKSSKDGAAAKPKTEEESKDGGEAGVTTENGYLLPGSIAYEVRKALNDQRTKADSKAP